jgi:uncharacterized membrane protein (Fun14 family)
MDNIIAVGVTFVLGIGVVGGFVVKYALQARKAVKLLKEGVDVVEEVLLAVEAKDAWKAFTAKA